MSTGASLMPSARTLVSGRVFPSPDVTSCKSSNTTCAPLQPGRKQQQLQQTLRMLLATLTMALLALVVVGHMEETQQQLSRQRGSTAVG
jgi:hypothetical protein